eukprot:8049781-Alexandrium_andersonii.AAC.1
MCIRDSPQPWPIDLQAGATGCRLCRSSLPLRPCRAPSCALRRARFPRAPPSGREEPQRDL